jgi:hypothetical protein
VRNLIGRLNARPPADLARIAQSWRVPLSASDRHGQVGEIYRALTDPRSVRDAWSTLGEPEQRMASLLSTSATPMAVIELARQLDLPEAETREVAISLYRGGWLAREGDGAELPLGELPRLFMPRELSHLVRRVQDEIDTGDLHETPLRTLLALLDDVELEEAAQTWGLKIVPGLRSREELSAQIMDVVADADRIAAVASRLKLDAAAIWQRLRDDSDGNPITLEQAAESARISRANSEGAQRFRNALAQLEESLLAWHTYRKDGSRWLFIPADIRSPKPKVALPPPPAVPDRGFVPVTQPRFALSWDLLTLLRALTETDRPRPRLGDPYSAPWLRRLNSRFWLRGSDDPLPGYVPFLLSLAHQEGLLAPEDGRVGTLIVTGEMRSWRDRTFEDQEAHLRWRWLSATDWIEGSQQALTQIWGGDWRSLRRGLLTALGTLPVDEWRPLEAVAAWIAEREPTLLGRSFTAALGQGSADDGAEGRRAATAAAVALTIERAFAWFGFVDVAISPSRTKVIRMTARGHALATGATLSDAERRDAMLVVRDDGTIELTDPTPLQVWSVATFAEFEQLSNPAMYRLTERSIERALTAGFNTAQIATFLRMQGKVALPAPVQRLLDQERMEHPAVQIRPATLLGIVDPDARERLRALLSASGISATSMPEGLLVTGDQATSERLGILVRSAGFTTPEVNLVPPPTRLPLKNRDD